MSTQLDTVSSDRVVINAPPSFNLDIPPSFTVKPEDLDKWMINQNLMHLNNVPPSFNPNLTHRFLIKESEGKKEEEQEGEKDQQEQAKKQEEERPHVQVIFDEFFSISRCRLHTDTLYVFGDNDIKRGKAGQAIIRDEPNAIGIPTKKDIKGLSTDFYTDTEYDANVSKIENAFNAIEEKLLGGKYKYLSFAMGGLGTGLARLPTKAPRTFAYLQARVESVC
jgi:hypothetical protein